MRGTAQLRLTRGRLRRRSREARRTRSPPASVQAAVGAIERMREAMVAAGLRARAHRAVRRRRARAGPAPSHARHLERQSGPRRPGPHRPRYLTHSVSRLLFFLLLIANLALGAHLWLTAPPAEPDFSGRERNREEAKIVAVIPPIIAARKAEETRVQVQTLAGAACVEFAGVASADLPQARDALAAMQLGDRLTERQGRGDHALLGLRPARQGPPFGRAGRLRPAQAGRERPLDPPRQRHLARRVLDRGGRPPLPRCWWRRRAPRARRWARSPRK